MLKIKHIFENGIHGYRVWSLEPKPPSQESLNNLVRSHSMFDGFNIYRDTWHHVKKIELATEVGVFYVTKFDECVDMVSTRYAGVAEYSYVPLIEKTFEEKYEN